MNNLLGFAETTDIPCLPVGQNGASNRSVFQPKRLARAAVMALTATGVLMLGTASSAQAEEEICTKRGSLAWTLPLQASDIGQSPAKVFARDEYRSARNVTDPDGQLAIGRAPDGTVSIKRNVPKGEVKRTLMAFESFDGDGIQHACLSFKLYLSGGFDFATAGTKLGWGLWGGEPTMNSGGIPPELQKGWTVRNVTNGPRGSRIYSYHLNREGPTHTGSKCKPYLCMHGETGEYSGPLASGRWVDVALEVRVNDKGKTNGFAKIWFDGKQIDDWQDLQFRDNRPWLVKGLWMTDMWGGDTSNPKNFSPKYQAIWYTEYRIYDLSGGATTASTPQSIGGSGDFTQISPNGTIPEGPVDLIWTAVAGADKYAVKLINAENNDVILYQALGPSAAECGYENGRCRYSVPDLGKGKYRWNVKYTDNGNYTPYLKAEFTVDSSVGTTLGSGSGTVAQISPSGAVPTTFDLVWTAGSNVDAYHVKIVNNDNNSAVFYQNLSVAAADCGFVKGQCRLKGVSLATGSYRWQLRHVTDNEKSDYLRTDIVVGSSTLGGTTTASTETLKALAPSGPIDDNTPILRWTEIDKADRYYVKIVGVGGRSDYSYGTTVSTDACSSSNNECRFTAPSLKNGDYDWMVREVIDGDKGVYRALRIRIR